MKNTADVELETIDDVKDTADVKNEEIDDVTDTRTADAYVENEETEWSKLS